MNTYDRDESWMGRHLRDYKPRTTIHSLVNKLFITPEREGEALRSSALPREEFADVSFYQGVIDWVKMRLKARKVIIRAGQRTWVDIKFVANYLAAKLARFLRGVYWFYDGNASPGEQAKILTDLLKLYGLPELGIWIDWERNSGGAHEGIKNVVAMMQEVERLLPGVEVGLYTGFYFFVENSNPITHRSQYAYLAKKKLWLAFYALLHLVRIPALWPFMTYWQKGTPAVGKEWGTQSEELDINEDMVGDPDPSPEPEPTEPPTGEPMTTLIGEVIVSELNIRPVAGTTQAAIGRVRLGDRVEASGEVNGWWNITKITSRAGANVPLPGPSCYAYEGLNNGYIKDLTPAPVPTPTTPKITKAVVYFDDGTTAELVPKP